MTIVSRGFIERARWLFEQPRGWVSLIVWGLLVFLLVGLPYGLGAFIVVGLIVVGGVIVFATQRDRRRLYGPAWTLRAPKGINTLREDERAGYFSDRKGYLWRKRLFFMAEGIPPVEVNRHWYALAYPEQGNDPVLIHEDTKLSWWWFEDTFYEARSLYKAADIAALVHQQERRRQQRLDHAHDLLAIDSHTTNGTSNGRPGIPEEVKRFVWRRDGGKCVQCGSTELLQFDHIIPVAMGGAHTPENLQVLCAKCNREKAATL